MKKRRVDTVIIGAGTAGLNARKELEKADKDWVMIESGPYGTTCARVGCMPSKLLIAAADAADGVSNASEFGISLPYDGWDVDGRAVMQRVQSERDRFVGFVVDATEQIPENRRIKGHARFLDQNTIAVDDEFRIETETTIIATGSTPWIPPQVSEFEDDVLTSDDIFELDDLPDSIAVFGTGVIGLELGQALDRLGVETTFFNPFDDVGLVTDPVIHEKSKQILSNELQLYLESEVQNVSKVGGGYEIRWKDKTGREHRSEFDQILAAAGRRPNVDGLGLENTDLERDESGVPISDPRTGQCGDSPIFIAGDAVGHRNVLHEASDEGRIAGANAAMYPDLSASVRRQQLVIGFTHPQMAIVGEPFAKRDKSDLVTGEVSFDNQGRARVMDVNRGHLRLYASKSDCRFRGAEMMAPRGEHMAHLLAWAMQTNMTVPEMLNMPFYHPVLEEGLRTALRDLAKTLKVEGSCPPEDFSESPGS